MLEKFNMFLDDDQQLVLKMSEKIFESSEKRWTISRLQGELNVSRHQTLMAFDLLQSLIDSLGIEEVDVRYLKQGTLIIDGLSTTVIKQVLKKMAQKSIRLNVFINNYLGIYGVQTQFLKKFGVSRATYYRNIQSINQIIKRDFKVLEQSDEVKIRQIIFSIIHYFFDGAELLPEQLKKQIPRLIDQLPAVKTQKLRLTEREKLLNFVFVQTCRINQGNVVTRSFITNQSLAPLKSMSEIWHVDCRTIYREFEYLHAYLIVNEILAGPIEKGWNVNLLDEVNAISDMQIKILGEIFQQKRSTLRSAGEQLLKVNAKIFSPFYFGTTFVDPVKKPFFMKTYPELSAVTQKMIEALSQGQHLNLDRDLLTQAYYAYILFLLTNFSQNDLIAPIEITVDFSNGPLYTKYITDLLKQFDKLNIKISSQLTKKTNIFLSDQPVKQGTYKQLIWRTPPVTSDLEALGSMIVKERSNLYGE
ncbi:hypothetical protein [Pediococcus stilesii]|nr:hypothetical protein [Pediococcus stilesii]